MARGIKSKEVVKQEGDVTVYNRGLRSFRTPYGVIASQKELFMPEAAAKEMVASYSKELRIL